MTERTQREHIRCGLVTSPGFLLGVAVLLVNDWYLKATYGNWLTGKVSDVAGLCALALLLTACWPRWRTLIHIAVGVAFVLWKSPAATPLIAAWNELGMFGIDRVLDYTDWAALAILPASWHYARVARSIARLVPLRPVITCIACVAFVATSEPRRTTRDGSQYEVPYSRAAALTAIDSLARADSMFYYWPASSSDPYTLYINLAGEAQALVALRELDSNRATLTVLEVSTRQSSDSSTAAIRRMFLAAVVAPLRRR